MVLTPLRFTPAGCVSRPIRLPLTAAKPSASSVSIPNITGKIFGGSGGTGRTTAGAGAGATAAIVAGASVAADLMGGWLALQPARPSSSSGKSDNNNFFTGWGETRGARTRGEGMAVPTKTVERFSAANSNSGEGRRSDPGSHGRRE